MKRMRRKGKRKGEKGRGQGGVEGVRRGEEPRNAANTLTHDPEH